MKKAILHTLATVVLCVGQAPIVRAESDPATIANIRIAEIQTGGLTDTTEEFVELYNPNETPVDVAGWILQYRAASGLASQTWAASSKKATIACAGGSPVSCTTIMLPHGRLVLTRTIANIAGAFTMDGGFASTGGEIRLVQPTTASSPLIVQDFVGYGNALDSEGQPAPRPDGGSSIKRKIDDTNTPVDTNNNADDFVAGCGNASPGIEDTSPLPYLSGCAAVTSTEPTQPDPEPTPPSNSENIPEVHDEPEPTPNTPTYLPITITELLPNPASPQQDANDEFIELYNPNDTAVTLQGYRLQTGSDYRYTFTLGDTPLGPHMYLAIPSAVSKLSLVNSGSGVRLLDPNGTPIYEVTNYGDAKEGQSWIATDTGWQWTLTPTPSAENVLTLPAPKPAAAATVTPKKKAATTAKTTAAKITTPKVAAPKKTASTTTAASPAAQPAVAQTPQYWLLIPIGAIAGGYALYEYRQDIAKISRKAWSSLTKNNKVPAPDEE